MSLPPGLNRERVLIRYLNNPEENVMIYINKHMSGAKDDPSEAPESGDKPENDPKKSS